MRAVALWAAAAAVLAVVIGVAAYLASSPAPMPQAMPKDALHNAGFTIVDPPVPVSDASFKDLSGTTYRLTDFRGKVLLVNFWASWCAPCLTEMPTLQALQAELGGPDFQVVAISIDRDGPERAAQFLKRVGVTAFAPFTDSAAAITAAHKVRSMPTSLLVSPAGRIIARYTGPAEWDSDAMISVLGDVADVYSGG